MNKIKIATIVFISMLLFGMTSCNNGSKELKSLVKQVNEQCPISQGIGSQLSDVTYKHNTVTLNYSVLSQLFNMDAIEAHQDEFREFMLENYQMLSDTTFLQIIRTLVDADANLEIKFTQEDGRSLSIQYNSDELSTCLNTREVIESMSPEEELEAYVQQSRSTLPLLLGNGIVKDNIQLTPDYLININKCDEEIVNIQEIGAEAQSNKGQIIKLIKEGSDPSFAKIVQLLRTTHRGLQYKYVGSTSGQEAVVTITPKEML